MSALSELSSKGWTNVNPPELMDEESVVARYRGKAIKAGFLIDRIKDSEEEVHFRYRTGKYDLDVKIDLEIGRGLVKVEEAEGYDNE
jgi:hypothetical protein